MATLKVAKQLVERLAEHKVRVVFAESCTGGLVSALLAEVPGVSDFLCGSAVTYRGDTKVQWLGVSAEDIEQHTAVSHPVAIQMARGVLEKTPEASLAASITGHLGPDAPAGFDGLVFISIATRHPDDSVSQEASRHQLVKTGRSQRQAEAAELVLQLVLERVG
jgi:nicotinamide-nucleotide amidase